MGNVYTQTWEEILENRPNMRADFEQTKPLLEIENVEIWDYEEKEVVKDWYSDGYVKREVKAIFVKFKGEERRIRFQTYFQPTVGEWVTSDMAPSHVDGKCHVCKHFKSSIEDDSRSCTCINVLDLKYLLDQIKQMKEHRLKFIL